MAKKTYNATFLVKRATTAAWAQKRLFVPLNGQIVVYSDYSKKTDEHGTEINVPGIKIGDGQVPVCDLPFIGGSLKDEIVEKVRQLEEQAAAQQAEQERQKQQLDAHIDDNDRHVRPAEREFWNNKMNAVVNGETLVLNRE